MSESAAESQGPGTNRSNTEAHVRSEQKDRRVGTVDRRVASTVQKMARDLHDLASAAEDEAVGQLLVATARVAGETTQSGILTALLEEGRRFASRTAFLLTRPGEVRGWAGRGFSDVEGARFESQEDSIWARISQRPGAVSLNADESTAVCRVLGAPAGGPGVLIPFTLRGMLGGVLYADRLGSEGILGVASLQLLTHSAAQAVETAAFRGDGGSPALRLSSEVAARTMTVWQPPEESKEESKAETTTSVAAAAAAAVVAAGTAAIAEAGAPTVEETPPAVPEAEEEATSIDEEAAIETERPVESVESEERPSRESAASEVEADESAASETEADDSEAVDFEMVSTTEAEEDLEAVEDIEAELEPEPELEDTSDLWAVEEEEPAVEEEIGEEEEATFVGSVPTEDPVMEPAEETAVEQPAEEPDMERPAMIPPEVGQETVRLDIAALQGQMPTVGAPVAPTTEEETAKLPQWEVEPTPDPVSQEFELEPEETSTSDAYEIEPELSEPVTAAMTTPDFSEDATIINPPRDIASPMEGGYVPPAPEAPSPEVEPATSTEVAPPADMAPTEVAPPADMAPTEVAPPADMAPTEVAPPPSSGFAAPPAPKADAAGTSQVVPPTDIQGPGSAFGAGTEAGSIPEGEEALHEEARRLARLLVSEIKLYNEEIIEEGRRSGNIYERLKDDIDRSRQMYEERIDPRLIESDHDYFRQELVQRLAGGDERLLGY